MEISRLRIVVGALSFSAIISSPHSQNIEITSLDTVGNVGTNCMLKVDSQGNPHVLYYDLTNQRLKWAFLHHGFWHIVETALSNGYDDFEVDNNLNIHCSQANFSVLNYIFINNDTAYVDCVDSTDTRYSDSSIELRGYHPVIICIQYLDPAYLIECTDTDDGWDIYTVCQLPSYPSGLAFKLHDNINFAALKGGRDTVLVFAEWNDPSVSVDTVFRDSLYGNPKLDLGQSETPIIIFSLDNLHDYNLLIASKIDSLWQYRYLDKAFGSIQDYL
jgi:hypothetical protein